MMMEGKVQGVAKSVAKTAVNGLKSEGYAVVSLPRFYKLTYQHIFARLIYCIERNDVIGR